MAVMSDDQLASILKEVHADVTAIGSSLIYQDTMSGVFTRIPPHKWFKLQKEERVMMKMTDYDQIKPVTVLGLIRDGAEREDLDRLITIIQHNEELAGNGPGFYKMGAALHLKLSDKNIEEACEKELCFLWFLLNHQYLKERPKVDPCPIKLCRNNDPSLTDGCDLNNYHNCEIRQDYQLRHEPTETTEPDLAPRPRHRISISSTHCNCNAIHCNCNDSLAPAFQSQDFRFGPGWTDEAINTYLTAMSNRLATRYSSGPMTATEIEGAFTGSLLDLCW